jgi:hypothetical protein
LLIGLPVMLRFEASPARLMIGEPHARQKPR